MRAAPCFLLGLLLVAAPGTATADVASVADGYDARLAALARRIEARAPNRELARRVADRTRRIASDPAGAAREIRERLDALDLVLVRVPGLFYRSHPHTGADLRVIERAIAAPVSLLETDEVGTVEDNARAIGAWLRSLEPRGRRAFLVSASKGSADVRGALEAGDGSHARVAAWLDLVGVLEGTPLTDPGVPWSDTVERWLPPETARSISHVVRAGAAAAARVPDAVLTVHVAAFPREADVSGAARAGFERLRAIGPNDGYVMLDALARAPGRVWLEHGADHYLHVDGIADRVQALLRVMVEDLETRGPAAP